MVFRDLWILLVLLPATLVFFWKKGKTLESKGFVFPSDETIATIRGNFKVWLAGKMTYVRLAALTLMIMALARPQILREEETFKEGIGIMLAIDCSSSMLVDDVRLSFEDVASRGVARGESLYMSRMEAVREVARHFIKSRPDDMIGIVAFAAEAHVMSPPTFDHEWLLRVLERVDVGIIEDATAIGSGILSSVGPLRDISAKSRVVVLLTDGINNYGMTPPLIAARASRALGIKVYTVGLAGEGSGLRTAADGSGRKVYREIVIDLDEDTLKQIALLTNGEYFRANDMKTLRESYSEIDRLEKAVLEERGDEGYTDIFPFFLFPALSLLLADILLSGTFLRRIP